MATPEIRDVPVPVARTAPPSRRAAGPAARRARPRTGRTLALIAAAAAAGLVGSVVPAAGVAAAPAVPAAAPVSPSAGSIAWSPCPDADPIMGAYLKGLECGSVEVPLDHGRPDGPRISIALTRARHTAPAEQYQGVVLLNRGQWPGPIGRDLPTRYAKGTFGLPREVGATYDWIGFDPRGVGASEPMVTCDPVYVYPGRARPDYVPRTAAEEQEWLRQAREYAESCARKYGDTLRHLTTRATARDLDLIRQALGQEQISYIGFDYGTYLGSVYASLFPDRVRRMVLDSVVRPSRVGYRATLDQNVAFQKVAEIFFAWIARYDSVYHLGTTGAEVEANYYKGMAMVREAPIDGKIGPAEYNDIFMLDTYRTFSWMDHAKVLSDWVLRQDPAGLRANFVELDYSDYRGQNSYAMYTAIQCGDAAWPRNWNVWRADHARQYRQGVRFLTWYNAWYNAPCAFWPVAAGQPPQVGHPDVEVLLVQPEHNAKTPLAGAYEVHRLFPNSRLVLERGGVHQSPSLSAYGNTCLNQHVSAYLKDGTRPASARGVDASCEANPAPDPTAQAPAAPR